MQAIKIEMPSCFKIPFQKTGQKLSEPGRVLSGSLRRGNEDKAKGVPDFGALAVHRNNRVLRQLSVILF
ncbi:hypothetical protein EFB08_02705 [Rufibacter latericius]|uniref:Uncharacterized protein n=1 Tax=Rufibacter latericius TaxID=2487040 RepID=A0A3M9N0X5_9BACT|nr:hypothetical protein EFB08_02705 [Rufibacter latericius]